MTEPTPPPIDGRRRAELLEEAIERARSYTPEWDPDEGDVGTAMLRLFADVAADVTTRLDRAPEKHRVAFFDALGFNRAPPQPARLPLVFQVAEGLAENVRISAGTQAVAPPDGEGTERVFEVPEGMGFEATPARLDAVYSVSPDDDAIFEHGTQLESGDGTQLFTGENVQEHVLYLGHTDFFTLTPTTEFELRLEGSDVDAFDTLRWEYYGTALVDDESVEGWHALPRRPRPETSGDTVVLRFKLEPESEFVETTLPVSEESVEETPAGAEPRVTEIETRWVRCSSPASLDADLYETSVSSVGLSLVSYGIGAGSQGGADSNAGSFTTDGGTDSQNAPVLLADMLFANDVPLPTKGSDEPNLYPFGEMPLPLDAFYVASDEAFSKKGMTVKLTFEGMQTNSAPLPAVPEPETFDPKDTTRSIDLSWEYWNGSGWTYLELEEDELWNGDERYVQFEVPTDTEPAAVSGHEHHWIRARVQEDGYLQFNTGLFYADDNQQVNPGKDDPVIWEMIHEAVPAFQKLTIDYPPLAVVSDGNGENGGGDGSGGNGGTDGAESPQVGSTGTLEVVPQHVVTHNSGSYGLDEARTLRPDVTTEVQPFSEVADRLVEDPKETLYLGFDGPLDDGPIQVLFSAVDKTYPIGFYPRTRWEYMTAGPDDPGGEVWEPLSTEDGTEGLTRRGIVGLVFPEATEPFERFGRLRHWVRAQLVSESQFDVDVTAGDARDVPGGEQALRILFDVENQQFRVENTTDQAFGLAGYTLVVDRWRRPLDGRAETQTPGEFVVPPGGTLVVRTELTTDQEVSGTVALETPDVETLFGDTAEAAAESRTNERGATVSGVPTASEVGVCEPLEPAVLATSPQWTTTPPTLRARGLYLNAGWADNVRTVSEEVLGSSNGSDGQTFAFGNQPVIEEAVWVDELPARTVDEREALTEEDPEAVDERTEEDGGTTAFWVRWTAVENFVESTADDRHYVVDRTEGRLTFGDGDSGAIPPIGEDNVKTSYRTGGGVDGNVPAETVAALVTALPYVEGVTNPDAGRGGADAERTRRAVERAARTLEDRNRAVTAADFERLSMSASRELARVRCIPGMDRAGTTRPGWVTVLLVPRTSEAKPTLSPEVRRRVEETLRTYAPAPVTRVAPEQVVVRGPSYLAVRIGTTLVVDEGAPSVAAVEERATGRLESFLHPLTGGPDGSGWAFGDLPCLSDFYALLERVEGVDRVSRLVVTFSGSDRNHVVASDEDRLPRVTADTLVFSGSHDVAVGGDPETGTGADANEVTK
ncbi:baseplate J/gp47 family protein [Halobium salinum]|uniref:Baseplate J/gp47 family protein n=1 Tax=Halobium salinum TaxID=1364940 RepID=A0ABD5PIG4_9EURY|nr:baseplate J/gp47 family protein [Halobium salinum]